MKSIRILDKDINLLGEIDTYEEFKVNLRYFSLSEFELRMKTNTRNIDKLIKNNLLLLGKFYNKVGIILHREFDGDNSNDTILIKGATLEGLIARKLIVPDVGQSYESYIGKQETIMKHFIDKNCINTRDPKRKLKRLVIAEDRYRGIDDNWRSSYEKLSDKLREICEYSGLGWTVTLDKYNKKYVFDVLSGNDLTVRQKINPPVIFRSDFNNIAGRHYIESIINSSNIVYAGTKEDATKLVLSVGEAEDFERIETFSSISSDDLEEVKREAQLKLQEYKELKAFEIEVNPTKTFVYEKDYNLGDIVTIQDKKLGITMDSRIVEIEEIHSKNSVKLNITFGNSIPTIITKLNKLEKKVR